MKTQILLKPVEMTPDLMADLENRKLISLLGAHKHDLPSEWGQTLDRPVYDCHERFGPHRLLTVTVNRVPFVEFATHPDKEDFIMIGDPDTKPLYVVIALIFRAELEKKIEQGSVSSSDFVCLKIKWNDPKVSFFTMLPDVAHGEGITERNGIPPSFYVTEGRDLPNDLVDLGNFELVIA